MPQSDESRFYNIGYCGGSGGFIFLHFLLLSDRYYVELGKTFNEALHSQWAINNTKNWKSNEYWPLNFYTTCADTQLDKILYFCNPTRDQYNGVINKNEYFDQFKNSYNNIKDPSWQNINSFDDFYTLPDSIKAEICKTLKLNIDFLYNTLTLSSTKHASKIWVYTDFNSQNELSWHKKAYFYSQGLVEKIQSFEKYTVMWNQDLVDQRAIYFLNHSDIQIKLQDWINTPELLIDLKLIDKISPDQLILLDHWKKLHPSGLLESIGIR